MIYAGCNHAMIYPPHCYHDILMKYGIMRYAGYGTSHAYPWDHHPITFLSVEVCNHTVVMYSYDDICTHDVHIL